MKETMKNAMKKLQESKKIVKESYSFQEIIDMMEEADTYSELNAAAEYINDPKLREEVIQEIETCREDGDEVSVAYSVVTSDLLDSMVNEVNESKSLNEDVDKNRHEDWFRNFANEDGIEEKTLNSSVMVSGEYSENVWDDGVPVLKSFDRHQTTRKMVKIKEGDKYCLEHGATKNWAFFQIDDGWFCVEEKRILVNESKSLTEARDRIAETIGKFIYDLGDEAWSYTGEAFNNLGQKLYTVNKNGQEKLGHNEIAKAVLEEYPELLVMLDVGNCIVFGKRNELNKMEKEPEIKESVENYIGKKVRLKDDCTSEDVNGNIEILFKKGDIFTVIGKYDETSVVLADSNGNKIEDAAFEIDGLEIIEESLKEKYPADGTYTEEERDAYYERTKKRVQEYADNLDLTPLFNWLKEITGINDLTFEVKKDTDAGKPRLNWESNNIVDKIGVMKFAFKDVRLESFGNGVTTTAPDYYDSEVIDFNKDYDVYYWCSVHFGYEHIDGGTNGASIGKAVCKEGKWNFSLDTERYKNR